MVEYNEDNIDAVEHLSRDVQEKICNWLVKNYPYPLSKTKTVLLHIRVWISIMGISRWENVLCIFEVKHIQ